MRRTPDKLRAALAFWDGTVNPRETLVESHLRSRSLELDDAVAGEVLRWHPRLKAMVALFRNIETDEPQAISRTFLDGDAHKIERKFMGPTKGAAIKLDHNPEVLGGLNIGEGIETCLAARMIGSSRLGRSAQRARSLRSPS
jgi:putative DNA primase/helicase